MSYTVYNKGKFNSMYGIRVALTVPASPSPSKRHYIELLDNNGVRIDKQNVKVDMTLYFNYPTVEDTKMALNTSLTFAVSEATTAQSAKLVYVDPSSGDEDDLIEIDLDTPEVFSGAGEYTLDTFEFDLN